MTVRILGPVASYFSGVTARIRRMYANFGLPLLTKELIEQSNRLRTYIVRMLYATVLFFIAMLAMQRLFTEGSEDVFAVLGQGRELFQLMVYLSFGGIYLFMPAISADAITLEKERDSLSLLFLTKLTPWTIILEKLLVRMVAMLSFLLTTLPLLALTYSLGGISSDYLFGGIIALLLATLQVGAVSILCSAYCRTTVAAFVLTYILLAFINLAFPAVVAPIFWGMGGRMTTPSEDVVWYIGSLFTPPMMFAAAGQLPLWAYLLLQIPSLFVSLVSLVFARIFLETRAFVPRHYYFRRLLKTLDKMFFALNDNRVTKGIILVGDRSVLPETEPIAWRETTRRSLGQFRYLVRIFVILELPVAVICMLAAGGEEPNSVLLGFIEPLLWLFGIVLISVSAAGLIPSERARESLDVLMTTPLPGREILRQKMAGISRLMIVAAVPMLTVILTGASLQVIRSDVYGWNNFSRTPLPEMLSGTLYFSAQIELPTLFALSMVTCVMLYLPLVAWLSMYIGLHVNSQAKAIPAALAALVLWCAVPCFVAILPEILFGGPVDLLFTPLMLCFSPVGFPALLHTAFLQGSDFSVRLLWLLFVVNTSLYAGLYYFLRRHILAHADHYLKRGDGTSAAPSGDPEVVRAALSPAAGA